MILRFLWTWGDGPATEMWVEASSISSTWNVLNPEATVWDAGATTWDLDGNVNRTVWDGVDTAYTDQTGTTVTWS